MSRKVRVLISPRSSSWNLDGPFQQALMQHWDVPGIDLAYQFSQSVEDGKLKAKNAIEEGVDTILIVGGDGMVNSIGSILVGSPVALGVIPAGSGNGFARYLGIPLDPEKAVQSLINAERHLFDVGTANGRPFFITCSMAWDAALVRTFEKFPVRGILPYALAAASEFIAYAPQPFDVVLDGAEKIHFTDPLVFTAANLSQFGGGARIAPHAKHDDGLLELVVISRQEAPKLLSSLNRLFDGTFDQLPGVISKRFQNMKVSRAKSAPIQVDGELIDAPSEVDVSILPRALTVLVPRPSTG